MFLFRRLTPLLCLCAVAAGATACRALPDAAEPNDCFPAAMRMQALLPPGTWSRKLVVRYGDRPRLGHVYVVHDDPRSAVPGQLYAWDTVWGDRPLRVRERRDLPGLLIAVDPVAIGGFWADRDPAHATPSPRPRR